MPQDIDESRKFYRDFFGEESDISYDNKQRYDILFSLINDASVDGGSRVLDVGAGSGRISQFLNERFDDVVSMDIVISSLLEDTLESSQVDAVEGALPSLPFNDETFDLVVCSEVLEHIPTRDAQYDAIRDLARVTRGSGHIVLTTPNPNSPQERMKDFAKKVGRKLGVAAPAEDGGQLVENWIPSQKLKSFIESDFQIVQFRGSYYNVYIPKVNLEKYFRPVSDTITDANLAPHYGLYQYYVVKKEGAK